MTCGEIYMSMQLVHNYTVSANLDIYKGTEDGKENTQVEATETGDLVVDRSIIELAL